MRRFLVAFFVLFSVVVCHKTAYAQGCLVGSRLYTVETTAVLGVTIAADLKVYKTPFIPTTSCFSGSIDTSKACFVCENGSRVILVVGATPLLYVVTCEGGVLGTLAARGTYYSNYVVECDLDDYSWLFGLSMAVVGLVVIRKKHIMEHLV